MLPNNIFNYNFQEGHVPFYSSPSVFINDSLNNAPIMQNTPPITTVSYNQVNVGYFPINPVNVISQNIIPVNINLFLSNTFANPNDYLNHHFFTNLTPNQLQFNTLSGPMQPNVPQNSSEFVQNNKRPSNTKAETSKRRKQSVETTKEVHVEPEKIHNQINRWFLNFIKNNFKGRGEILFGKVLENFLGIYSTEVYEEASTHNGQLVLKMSAEKIDCFFEDFINLVEAYINSSNFSPELWGKFCALTALMFNHYNMSNSQYKSFANRLEDKLLNYVDSWSKRKLKHTIPDMYSSDQIHSLSTFIRQYQILIQVLSNQNMHTAAKVKGYSLKVLKENKKCKAKQLEKKIKKWEEQHKGKVPLELAKLFLQFILKEQISDLQKDVIEQVKSSLIEIFENRVKQLGHDIDLVTIANKIRLKNHVFLYEEGLTKALQIKEFNKNFNYLSPLNTQKVASKPLPKGFKKANEQNKARLCIGFESIGRGKKAVFNLRYLIAIENKSKLWEFYPFNTLDVESYGKAVDFFKSEINRLEQLQLHEFAIMDSKDYSYDYPLFPSSQQLNLLADQVIVEDLLILRNSISSGNINESFPKIGKIRQDKEPEDSSFIRILTRLVEKNIGIIYLGDAQVSSSSSSSLTFNKLLENFNKATGMEYIVAQENLEDEDFTEERKSTQTTEPALSNPIEIIEDRDSKNIFKKSCESSLNALKACLTLEKYKKKNGKVDVILDDDNENPKQVKKDNFLTTTTGVLFRELVRFSKNFEIEFNQFIKNLDHSSSSIDLIYATNENLTIYQNKFLKKALFLYSKNHGILLADDMGLGKTVQSLALIHRLRNYDERSKNRPFLILAPACAMSNWKADAIKLIKFPEDSIVCYHGTERNKKIPDLNKAAIIVTTYETYYNDQIALEKSVDLAGLVMDEAHLCLNPSSKKFKTIYSLIKKLSQKNALRLALTGTPIQNQIVDLYYIMSLINPNLMGELQQFNHYYIHPIKEANRRIGQLLAKNIPVIHNEGVIDSCKMAAERLNELKQVIRFCTIRRTKEDLAIIAQIQSHLGEDKKVPGKEIENIHFNLSEQQMQLYLEYIKKDELNIIHKTSQAFFAQTKNKKTPGDLIIHDETIEQKQKRANFLELRTKMCQMICHPDLLKITELVSSSQKVKKSSKIDSTIVPFADKIRNLTVEELMQQSGKIAAIVTALEKIKAKEEVEIREAWLVIIKLLKGESIHLDSESVNQNLKVTNQSQQELQGRYDNLDDDEKIEFLTKIIKIEEEINKSKKSYYYNQIKQVTGHKTTLLDAWANFYETELKQCEEGTDFHYLLTQIHHILWSKTEKILYFTQWVEMENILAKILGERFGERILFFGGKTKEEERNQVVNRFNTKINRNNLVLMLKAGGVGINLGTANNVFILDPWFSPGPIDQASDRARRLTSQRAQVKVTSFYANNTIEKSIMDCAQLKKEFIQFMFKEGEEAIEEWLMHFLIKDYKAIEKIQENLENSTFQNRENMDEILENHFNSDYLTTTSDMTRETSMTIERFVIDGDYTDTTLCEGVIAEDAILDNNYNNDAILNIFKLDLPEQLNYDPSTPQTFDLWMEENETDNSIIDLLSNNSSQGGWNPNYFNDSYTPYS
jgi:SNF2 family DNA or RNA helicase